jgi:hypothetical protein
MKYNYLLNFILFFSIIWHFLNAEIQFFLFKIFILPTLGLCCPWRYPFCLHHSWVPEYAPPVWRRILSLFNVTRKYSYNWDKNVLAPGNDIYAPIFWPVCITDNLWSFLSTSKESMNIFLRGSIYPFMALQPLLGFGLPQKFPLFVLIFRSSPPSSRP